VRLDRVLAQEQSGRDLTIRLAGDDELCDLELAPAEGERAGTARPRLG
jgi:hypothetical protein